jgi:peptidoglycan/LPS O-acetylase OafA/YrhL
VKARNDAIDLLRGVAITLVMLLHFSLTYRLAASPLAAWLTRDGVRAVVNNGNFGVTMFFVVSGYLITSNSLQRYGSLGAIPLREFLLWRAARILPGLLLAVTVIVVLGLFGLRSFTNVAHGKALPPSFFIVAVGSLLSFTHNVLMQSVGYFNYALNIYWSLSVEEMFYLAFPLLCVVVRRRMPVVVVCVAAIAVGPVYRGLHADNELYFMYGYPACFDALACGVLAALAAQRAPPARGLARWLARGLVPGAAITLALAYLNGIQGHEVFGFTAVAVSAAVLVYALGARCAGTDPSDASANVHPVGAGDSRRWAARALAPLRWSGRHSYELYLFHIIVLGLMRDAVSRDQLGYAGKLPGLVLFLAVSALVAAWVANHVTEPLNAAWRARFQAASAQSGDGNATSGAPGSPTAFLQKDVP